METKFDLVIFDMDGLMLDTEKIAMDAFIQVIEQDYHLSVDQDFYCSMIGMPDLQMEIPMKKVYGENFPFQEFFQRFDRCRDEITEKDGIPVKKGLLQLLDFLTAKGIRKVVATSSIRSSAEKKLKDAGIESYFDYYVCGDEVSEGKPNPEVFCKALEKACVPPEKAIVLEDSINGIKAAHRAGIPCIFIKDLVEPPKEVLDLVFHRMADLSQVISLFQ